MAVSAKMKRELAAMIKPRNGSVARVVRAAPIERVIAVNDHQARHGDYVPDGHRGCRNQGGTPIARWMRDGQLSETQLAAINFCVHLWERAGRYDGLVMDLLKVIGQPPSSGWAQQEALDELVYVKGLVPRKHWNIFENVCRFDMAAGDAGLELASNKRSAIDAARICVCFVADIIAMKKRF